MKDLTTHFLVKGQICETCYIRIVKIYDLIHQPYKKDFKGFSNMHDCDLSHFTLLSSFKQFFKQSSDVTVLVTAYTFKNPLLFTIPHSSFIKL